MRASTTLLLSTFALLRSALAIPPACLLGALNNDQQNLANIDAICSKSAADVQGNISNICGDMTDEALSYFADTCKQVANVSVASATSASATKTSGSGTGTSATGTRSTTDVLNDPTPTGRSGGSGSASTAAGGSGTSTGAAAPTHAAGSFAAVAVAAAGFIAAV